MRAYITAGTLVLLSLTASCGIIDPSGGLGDKEPSLLVPTAVFGDASTFPVTISNPSNKDLAPVLSAGCSPLRLQRREDSGWVDVPHMVPDVCSAERWYIHGGQVLTMSISLHPDTPEGWYRTLMKFEYSVNRSAEAVSNDFYIAAN